MLVEFGFGAEDADVIFAIDIADYNPRSRRAFEKVGFQLYETISQPAGKRAEETYDLVIRAGHLATDGSR